MSHVFRAAPAFSPKTGALLALLMLSGGAALAQTTGCTYPDGTFVPHGQSCMLSDGNAGTCNGAGGCYTGNQDVPELPEILLPAFMLAAAGLARRSRKRALAKRNIAP